MIAAARCCGQGNPDAARGVEGQDRELRLAQLVQEALTVRRRRPGDDPVAPLEEAVLLLDRLHPLVHLRLPEVDDLLGAGALEALDESTISRALYTRNLPDPDLIIRTSGEQRISNFLLWQIAYSEIYVTDRLWPDFNGLHLLEAIAAYQRRERRFGGLGESFTDEAVDTLQPAEEVAAEIKDHLIPKAETKQETK